MRMVSFILSFVLDCGAAYFFYSSLQKWTIIKSWFCWRLKSAAAEFCSTASWLHVHFSWLTFPDFSGGPSPDCDNRQGPATYHDPPLVFDLTWHKTKRTKPTSLQIQISCLAATAHFRTAGARKSERWSELSKISGFQSLIGVLVCQVLLSWRWFIREICCVLNFKQSCDRISFHWGSFSRRKPRLLL